MINGKEYTYMVAVRYKDNFNNYPFTKKRYDQRKIN